MGGKKNKIEYIFSKHHLPVKQVIGREDVFDICTPGSNNTISIIIFPFLN